MGITIHYRGTIDDLCRIEEFEDRVTDLVFALGGKATVWRSWDDRDRTRALRGLMIDMAPGQDTLSLVLSPEGHLTPLFQMEEAEQTPFDEPPYCFCKTQFGSAHGHIAIVHLLDAMRQKFFRNLEVIDEGEYYETRDAKTLTDKMQFLGSAIKSLAEGLREHGLNEEAAEDPNIVANRIERIAMLVQRKMSDAPDETHLLSSSNDENPSPDEAVWHEPSLADEVAAFDRLRRQNDLRSERMARRIDEATATGTSTGEAIDQAMRDEGFEIPTKNRAGERSTANEFLHCEASENENANAIDNDADSGQCHPALQMAERFLLTVMDLSKNDSTQNTFFLTLMRSATEMVGGIAQATGDLFEDRHCRALAISQLKRSLSGLAFARGAVFGLHSDEAIDGPTSQQLHDQLDTILSMIHELTELAWDEAEFS